MTNKTVSDFGASARERLLQLSRKTNRSFEAVLRQYGQERFLFRLAASRYKSNFILKGGLLFLFLSETVRRPTIDIDFLGIRIDDDANSLKKIFSEIVAIPCQDGIEYHSSGITIERIKEGTDFNGSRIIIPAVLARARVKLQIDVAFGDAITKQPQMLDFPTLLDHSKPAIFAYSFVTWVAEKFQAIVERLTATSRMKDFFDIVSLSEMLSFSGNDLINAFSRTFERHSLDLQRAHSVFTAEFASNPGLASMWKGFLARDKLPYTEFNIVMQKIRIFLEPVISGTCKNQEWNEKSSKWELTD